MEILIVQISDFFLTTWMSRTSCLRIPQLAIAQLLLPAREENEKESVCPGVDSLTCHFEEFIW
jgi:hypothetical protein